MEFFPGDWSTGTGYILYTQFLATHGWSQTIGRAISADWSLSKGRSSFPLRGRPGNASSPLAVSRLSLLPAVQNLSKSEQRSHGMDLVRTCSLAYTALDHGSNLPTLMPSRTSGT
ncbi:uncharacterized protein APUU_20626A [Aspergillus puulaauensis]|uniref:Uncharacterized protein n=1 Tax=Aspergillus puulaauensis TaxID=1220207 RepID=A0A7R7XF37_9EURO|nr:uncharacterized protein APUU_20626A [Aspergillus puulaauensis]BCS20194.1 hypothetical protein APUU_20626A [Aspergillus puulaauensis]